MCASVWRRPESAGQMNRRSPMNTRRRIVENFSMRSHEKKLGSSERSASSETPTGNRPHRDASPWVSDQRRPPPVHFVLYAFAPGSVDPGLCYLSPEFG